MFQLLSSKQSRENDNIQGFGYSWDDTVTPTIANTPGIAGGSSRTVSIKILSGIFNQKKYLPLIFCPISIEFELVNRATDCVIDPATATSDFFS